MATRVGDFLRHDPLKLRFTSSNTSNLGPKSVIKKSLNQSVADITQTGYYTNHPSQIVLYYEKLDVSIVELETKKSLKITWTGQHNKEEVSTLLSKRVSQIAHNPFCRSHIHSCYPRPAHSATWPMP
jgi:ubiquitin carboxyl-terminal hydrolase 7